ncbi:MAG: YlmH/Sll1252 family protein [Cellulosilyticum sp.]|nr:hypothetical protein [Cellulosilyticum sp.]MEE1070835.1 YlmH/Sll1252 family protein [Cellulosilyticum sp.]
MKNLFEHIKGIEERQFVKTVLEYSKKAEQQNRPFFTHFHNKDWMQSLLTQYVAQNAYLSYGFFGGYEDAERQILAISPYELTDTEYLLGILNIEVKTGIGKTLSHRDYLGAIMGLGIDRNTIGDIILHTSGAYVFLEMSMIPYIRSQLVSIGKYQKIQIDEVDLSDVYIEKPKVKMIESTVSALRMDAVCAVAFGMSRNECAKLIQGDKARCNGLMAQTTSIVKEGDVLTLRGFGKAKLKSINGQTKKDRTHITIEKYI